MITPYFPYFSASNCNDLKEAEKWRIQVIREASKKMSQIQNAGLGEFKIRDLNDEINKALREKRHWENRILELGGRDMRRRSRMLDKEGKEVPGVHGYKYFGAARDLPGKICKGTLSRDHLMSGMALQQGDCREETRRAY